MHEFSLAQQILEIVEENATANNFSSISEIVLEVGTLSGVEITALDLALESLKPGSVLRDASITRIIVKAEAMCLNCGKIYSPEDFFSACPACGSYGPEIKKGKELKVKSITAE